MHFDFIFETQGFSIVAFGMHAGPAHRRIDLVGDHRKAERSEKSMFGRFHVSEKIGVMNYASHVGLRELDSTDDFKFVSHKIKNEPVPGPFLGKVPLFDSKPLKALLASLWP